MGVAKAKPVILRHDSKFQIICIKGENKEKPVFLMRSIFGEKTDCDVSPNGRHVTFTIIFIRSFGKMEIVVKIFTDLPKPMFG